MAVQGSPELYRVSNINAVRKMARASQGHWTQQQIREEYPAPRSLWDAPQRITQPPNPTGQHMSNAAEGGPRAHANS
jgi:hypothetical protein